MNPELVADRPSLAFVATLAERGTANREGLAEPADLRVWVQESGLVDDPGPLGDADLRSARALREAVFALVAALIYGADAPEGARSLVNDVATRPGPRLAVQPGGRVSRTGGLDAALSALAADVVDLHDSPDRELLHWCADPRCTRPFVDRSRGARRRWCGMKGCGDRAKAAAYRQRQRSAV